MPSNEFISRAFQAGLAKLGVDWFSRIEVNSVEIVQTYVANGYGIGVTVGVPMMKFHPQVRVLPLDGFEPVKFGVALAGRKKSPARCLSQNCPGHGAPVAGRGKPGLVTFPMRAVSRH